MSWLILRWGLLFDGLVAGRMQMTRLMVMVMVMVWFGSVMIVTCYVFDVTDVLR